MAYQFECCNKSIKHNLNSNKKLYNEGNNGGIRQDEEMVTDVVSQGGY